MQFRTDINGLRAIAVIAVVLFHFNAAWLPGGFAGVDVFFVISGFLMTGIIFRGIEKNNFSLLKFYVARANRIIPALAALCLVLLVFGWFYLNSIDYKALGNHVASSLAFVSNIIYWQDSGYFAASSHEKWLLHTWSLSAEWQFYIIYPLVLVVMRKFMSIGAMKATVLVGTILGFIFCIFVTYKLPNSAYYLLPARAWEMMIGGVAYLYPWTVPEQKKKPLEWLGLLLIVASYFFISKDSPWPGYLALFPVLGAFFILQAQRNDSVITNNVIFQKLGAWSYSIYLWHWPLVVAIYYYSLDDVFIYLGLVLSVLLGFLSNKYIEKIKFRNDFSSVISYLKCKPMYMALCVILLSSIIINTDGANIEQRSMTSDPKFLYLKKYLSKDYKDNLHITFRRECNFLDSSKEAVNKVRSVLASSCLAVDKNKRTVLIWGDSHAQAIAQGFQSVNYNLMQVATSSCKPDINQQLNLDLKGSKSLACDKSNAYAVELIKKSSPDMVVLAQRNKHELTDFNAITQTLKAYGVKQVVVIGPVIQLNGAKILPKLITRIAFDVNNKYMALSLFNQDIVLSEMAMKAMVDNNYLYLSLFDFLCENKQCLVKVDNDNTPLLFDYGHLTYEGANYIYKSYLSGVIESP